MSQTIILILGVILLAKLIWLRAIDFSITDLSDFEIKRRAEAGDASAKLIQNKKRLLPEVLALKNLVEFMLLVALIICLVYLAGWFLGFVSAVLLFGLSNQLTKFNFIRRRSQSIYRKYDSQISRVVVKIRPLLKFFKAKQTPKQLHKINSKQELIHQIDQANHIFSASQRLLLQNAVVFEGRVVGEAMTPASDVKTVKSSEVLGPLTLDSLHKHGHSFFPVIKRDIHHVTGILFIGDALSQVSSSSTSTASQLMKPSISYINQNETLPSTLAAFLRRPVGLFIVLDEHDKTVGILALSDIVRAIFGRELPADPQD